ncbi:MAG: acyl-CoA thioesterase [Alphaproteobacteria bacterium]|nr:acyl-CoA thioesterase [Rhodospirillales bacterium]MCW9045547.1 acyl-CoA thioesterase [Alphaproteobacteria bacterium]
MGVWLGLARISITRLLGKSVNLLDEVTLDRRVMPFDLDPNMHMTNSVYYTLMDLGRIEHLLYSGTMEALFKRRMGPAIGGIVLRFRRSLAPFQKYKVVTKLAGWDDKWLYYEQRIESGGDAYALAYSRLACTGNGGAVPISEVLKFMNFEGVSPDLGGMPERLEAACGALKNSP